MVWQRAGTVAVQNGSNTVIGTNVDFAASSRNGDSFVGPDGATYEVANVASSTVISILPAYKGPTVSSAPYAIMPVQGYDKMLSDAFNSLNNQFGPKLAALGTTGNYDVLPVTKGGTGGTDPASARVGLGLGSAATANIGTSVGNAMPVGAFGLGGAEPGVKDNIDHVYFTEFSAFDTSSLGIKPTFPYGTTISVYGTYKEVCQLGMSTTSNQLAYRFFRSASGGWSSWATIYHTGNTTRAADGTLKAI